MATLGIEQVTENAIRAVARDCGSLSIECSDVAGYVEDVSEPHRRTYQDARRARGRHDAPAHRPGAGRRFDRRGAAAERAGQGQARSRQGGDRGHDLGLQGADRTGRPAGRTDGGLRHRDEPGPERVVDDRGDRAQDQHAGAQRDDRGGARRRCRAQLRGGRRRSEETRPRHPRRDQPDRARRSAN